MAANLPVPSRRPGLRKEIQAQDSGVYLVFACGLIFAALSLALRVGS